jgi:hypothetical protein
VIIFEVSSLVGHTVSAAQLNLTLLQTRKDQFPDPGTVDNSEPFINPGLGALSIINIDDSYVQNSEAYGAASIGNDPGVIVAADAEAPALLSIDVSAALQEAADVGDDFLTFRIQTAIETDWDGLNDVFFTASADHTTEAWRPVIVFELGLPNQIFSDGFESLP